MYANINNHGEYAYGGKYSGSSEWNGQSAGTPAIYRYNKSKLELLYLQFQLLLLQQGSLVPWQVNLLGAGESDLTYGAGGGGGAGGGTYHGGFYDPGHYAGDGGDGAPGIVIIEW